MMPRRRQWLMPCGDLEEASHPSGPVTVARGSHVALRSSPNPVAAGSFGPDGFCQRVV
jgi:hypothetical protein